jgi:hypothetical protein
VRAIVACLLASCLVAPALAADDYSVSFDHDVDFTAFRTFRLGPGELTSERPELQFPAVRTSVGGAIRTALMARGLREVPDRADLVVDFSVVGVDYAIGSFGRPNAIRPGQRGRGGRASGGAVDFTEARLVIDLSHGDPAALVWRGVFYDTEANAARLAQSLPKDAATLLGAYPPKRGR